MSDRGSVSRVLGKWDNVYGERILAVLEPDEELIAAGPGAFEGRLLGKDASVPGALFVTNQRIIKLTENVIGIKETDSLPLEQISAVDETTLLLGLVQVKITAPDTSLKATGRGLQGMAAKINAARRKKKEPEQPVGVNVADPLEQIEKLGELRSKGLIDQAEFEEGKASLLGSLNGQKVNQSVPLKNPQTGTPKAQQKEPPTNLPVPASAPKPRSATRPAPALDLMSEDSWFETPRGWFLDSPLLVRLGVLALLSFTASYFGALDGREFWAVFLTLLAFVAGFWSLTAAVVRNQSFFNVTKRASRWARIPVWLAFAMIMVPVISAAGDSAGGQDTGGEASASSAEAVGPQTGDDDAAVETEGSAATTESSNPVETKPEEPSEEEVVAAACDAMRDADDLFVETWEGIQTQSIPSTELLANLEEGASLIDGAYPALPDGDMYWWMVSQANNLAYAASTFSSGAAAVTTEALMAYNDDIGEYERFCQ